MSKEKGSHPTIVEAVETLSNIADLEFDRSALIASMHDVALPTEAEEFPFDIRLIDENNYGVVVDKIKETFQVILSYLKGYYKKEYRYMPNQQTTEGIKAIMVLVGEAAKKLDKYTSFSQNKKLKSITDLKEYKRLQDFYLSRIARKIDEGTLSKWILALSQRMLDQHRTFKPQVPSLNRTKHVFVDLESVKKDTEYELFFIRKEDGSRFFSPRLIRNIKLACDFGEQLGTFKRIDPLDSLILWKDQSLHAISRDILRLSAPLISHFYKVIAKQKPEGESELSYLLGKTVMALFLCANSHNIYHDPLVKNCADYFTDFQKFLRDCLSNATCQKAVAYPPKQESSEAAFVNLIYGLCHALFVQSEGNTVMLPHIHWLIEESLHEQSSEHSVKGNHAHLWNQLANEYHAVTKLIKRHANGPLIKVLDLLEDGSYQSYDPISQWNIPSKIDSWDWHGHEMMNLRIPSPTHQEFTHKAVVVDEFKSFLLAMAHTGEKHLLFNLQDRTSWKDYARCVALEELQHQKEFSNLVVVTLAKDTEFYHQLPPYQHENHADVFMQQFKEHLEDESSGFYFPDSVRKMLFPNFIENAFKTIHQVFFGNRNILVREHRLNFIEIFYALLELKLMEIVKPVSFSLTCKDGIDIGPAASALLYCMHKWLNEEKIQKIDLQTINGMLYIPSIMIRERIMLLDRFQRFQNALKEIESVQNDVDWGVLKDLIS